MNGRIEFKYLLPQSLLAPVRATLLPYVQTDPFADHAGPKEYTVRSIYYDTPQASCYYEKVEGLEQRRKFRIRGYDSPGAESLVFLEIKRKRGSEISKSRAPMLYASLRSFMEAPDIDRTIIATGRAENREDARRFLYHYHRLHLRPAVLVAYDREPFFGKFDSSLRVTFDKRLRGSVSPTLSTLYEERGLWQALSGYHVLEIKFFRGALPQWVSRLIKEFGLQRMALSKYAICLDSGQAHWGPDHVRRRIAASGFLSG